MTAMEVTTQCRSAPSAGTSLWTSAEMMVPESLRKRRMAHGARRTSSRRAHWMDQDWSMRRHRRPVRRTPGGSDGLHRWADQTSPVPAEPTSSPFRGQDTCRGSETVPAVTATDPTQLCPASHLALLAPTRAREAAERANVRGPVGAQPQASTQATVSHPPRGPPAGERSYTWDAQGRLMKVGRGQVTEEYVYDHTDKRTVKRTTEDGHTKTTLYVADDYEERDGDGVRYASLGSERVVRLDPVDEGPRTSGGAKPAVVAPPTPESRGPLGPNGWGWTLAALLGAAVLLLGQAMGRRARQAASRLPTLREALLGAAVAPRGPPRRLAWSLSVSALLGIVLSALGTPACSCSESKPSARDKSVEITVVPEAAEFYLADIQGSPLATVSAKGAVTSTTAYHPYGAARRATGAAGDPFGFVGNEEDRGSGISDFRARAYRPELGVFLAVDPVALFEPEKTLKEPFRGQAYGYGGGNPITNADREGQEVEALAWMAATVAAAAKATLVEIGATAVVAGEALLVVGATVGVTVLYVQGASTLDPQRPMCFDSSSCSGRSNGDALAERYTFKAEAQKVGDARPKAKDRRKEEQSRSNEDKHGDPDYEEPASEEYAQYRGRQAEKRSGKDARRAGHDSKEPGEGDRSKSQLKEDYE
jgi:RHS repeat-associated protein